MGTDLTQHPRRSWRPTKRVILGVLIALCLIGFGYGVYEFTIWSIPMDSFTFIERNASGKVLYDISSSNAQEATTLRSQINGQRELNTATLGPVATAPCVGPMIPPPVVIFRYEFRWHGQLVEQVWDDAGSNQCDTAWATAGGVTVAVINLPIIPQGALQSQPSFT